jgi:uncharacterized protein YhhL (DUF1145 family)
MAGPALTVANGSGFTVTAAIALRVLLHCGVTITPVIAILVKVTLNVPADAVEALDEAAVVNVTAPSPVPVKVFPDTAPSVYVIVHALPLVLLTVTVSATVDPAHIAAPVVIVAVGSATTVIVDAVELAAAHTPLCTTALYWVVVATLTYA